MRFSGLLAFVLRSGRCMDNLARYMAVQAAGRGYRYSRVERRWLEPWKATDDITEGF